MKVGLVSYNTVWEEIMLNAVNIKEIIEEVAPNDLDLLIFPEMSLFGFSMNTEKIDMLKLIEADKIIRDTLSLYSLDLIIGTPIIEGDNIYNGLVFYTGSDKIIHYKSRLFEYSGEHYSYCNSIDGVTLFNNFALSICFELRFPELFVRDRLRYKQIINIANWPITRINHYKLLCAARAVENQCFVYCVNRSGSDINADYGEGYAEIFDYNGKKLQSYIELNKHGKIKLFNVDQTTLTEFRSKFNFYG